MRLKRNRSRITARDLLDYSPSRHCMDIGSIFATGLSDGINGTDTNIDYSKLNAGSKEQFDKNMEILIVTQQELWDLHLMMRN